MSIHKPKLISSIEGLGLKTIKDMQYQSEGVGIGTEIWTEVQAPWKEGEVVIALPGYKWVSRWEVGKPYVITKFYDNKGNFVAMYCDICRPVRQIAGGFEFDDLYLDVWQPEGMPVTILDEDELRDALELNYITKSDAHAAYLAVEELTGLLEQKSEIFQF